MRKKIINGLYAFGSLFGFFAVVFRVVDLISYQEMKFCGLVAILLLGAARVIEKKTI